MVVIRWTVEGARDHAAATIAASLAILLPTLFLTRGTLASAGRRVAYWSVNGLASVVLAVGAVTFASLSCADGDRLCASVVGGVLVFVVMMAAQLAEGQTLPRAMKRSALVTLCAGAALLLAWA